MLMEFCSSQSESISSQQFSAEAFSRLSCLDRSLLIELGNDLHTKHSGCLRNIPLSKFNIFSKSI